MSSDLNFLNKNIAVLGFGIEGQSAARYLTQNGAKVTVLDEKEENALDKEKIARLSTIGVNFAFDSFGSLDDYDFVVRSPGIPLTHAAFNSLPAEKITSATKLFFDLCPAPIIGITGTKGKGTTSSLIYEMLKAEGKDAFLGGNIGIPALDFLDKLTPESIVVLELSSFQLIDLHKSPHIAVMLMVTSDHLDYHKDIYEYVEAKRNILKYQTASDFAVVNKDYPVSNESDIYTDGHVFYVSRERGVEEGCFVEDGNVVVSRDRKTEVIIDTKDILLPGKHNWENVCAAVMAATVAGVSKEKIVDVLKSFKGLEHRLELVSTVRGVKYYDDSFSTTPETAIAAIEAFENPEVLILGGSSKSSDFTMLGETISKAENIKAIIGLGAEWSRMKESVNKYSSSEQSESRSFTDNSSRQARTIPLIIEGLTSMEEVVKKAAEITEPGDVVLLSPACASFDMFKDYKDRGNQFKDAVNSL
jgi:UDP-N-acetylmuramoylalanine--D-glutamate ligase